MAALLLGLLFVIMFMFIFLAQDFKVLTLLGKGSFACVYRAKSVKTGLEVAIKTVRIPQSVCVLMIGNHSMLQT